MQKSIGWLVVFCFTFFALFSIIAHFATGFDPVRASLSTYATGPRGWIEESGFVLSLIGQVSLTIGLFLALPRTKRMYVGIIAYCVSSIGVLLVVLFPSSTFEDRPTDGLHWLGAFMTFAAFPLMALVISLSFRSFSQWRTIASPTLTIVALNIVMVLIFAVLYFATLPGKFIAEKVDVVFTTAWQLVVGYHLAQVSEQTGQTTIAGTVA